MNYRSIFVMFCILPCFIMMTGCDKPVVTEASVRPVKTMMVGVVKNEDMRQYPAKVRATQRVKLAFQVGGRILKFPVKAGDHVKKGEIIAELDPRDYENALKSAAARFNESKTDFDRQSILVKKSAVSVSVFEAKKMAYEVAESDMRVAQKAFDDTTLRAPFDGVVAGTYVDNFQNVKAQEVVISLQDISHVELLINVPEKDVIRSTYGMTIDSLKNKMSLYAIFPSLGSRRFVLKIKEFETEADSSSQTFKAVMTMPAPADLNIMPGMTALVMVSGSEPAAAKGDCWVPVSAVTEDSNGKRHVWLLDKELRAHKRIVDVGTVNGDRIQLKNGLNSGDKIAITGVNMICEGMKVKELRQIDGRDIQ